LETATTRPPAVFITISAPPSSFPKWPRSSSSIAFNWPGEGWPWRYLTTLCGRMWLCLSLRSRCMRRRVASLNRRRASGVGAQPPAATPRAPMSPVVLCVSVRAVDPYA
jgi:hypothetical protein